MLSMVEQVFLWWVLYAFIGWVWETLLGIVVHRRFIDRGVLIGPLCPLYGFGGLLVVGALRGADNPLALFLSSGFLACTLEYLTSVLIERLFHLRLWDYSDKPFNLNGRVYLNGFLAFGLGASAIVLAVQPAVAAATGSWPAPVLHAVAGSALVLLAADATVTLAGLTSFDDRLACLSQDIADEKKRRIAGMDERLERGDQTLARRTAGIRRRLIWPQRRLIRVFPNMSSTRHVRLVDEVRRTLREHKYPDEHGKAGRRYDEDKGGDASRIVFGVVAEPVQGRLTFSATEGDGYGDAGGGPSEKGSRGTG